MRQEQDGKSIKGLSEEFVSFPLKGRDNLDGFSLSNAVDADKFKGVEDRICFLKAWVTLSVLKLVGFFWCLVSPNAFRRAAFENGSR